MANPNLAQDGAATQFKKGRGNVNSNSAVTPERLAKRFDRLLMRQMNIARGAGGLIETDLLAVVERRLKALGEVRKPKEEPVAPDSKEAAVDDVVRAAIAAQKAKKSPPKEG